MENHESCWVLRTPSNDREPFRISSFSPVSCLAAKEQYCQEHTDLQVSDVKLLARGRLLRNEDVLSPASLEVFVVAPRLVHKKVKREEEERERGAPVREEEQQQERKEEEGPRQQEPAVAAAAPIPPAPVVAGDRFRFGLLLRLAALATVLAQGGDSGRAALLCAGAWLLFAWARLPARFSWLHLAALRGGPGKLFQTRTKELNFLTLFLSFFCSRFAGGSARFGGAARAVAGAHLAPGRLSGPRRRRGAARSGRR